jgi:hypothetical protein
MVVGMRLCRVGDADLACRLRQPSDTRVCDAAVTSLDLGAARVCVVTTKGDRAPSEHHLVAIIMPPVVIVRKGKHARD